MHTIAFLSSMNEYSIERFINSFQDAKDRGETDVLVRVNSPGGLVNMGWSWLMTMRDFLQEGNGNSITYRGEGTVGSMAAFATLFVSEATAIQQTKFVFHRAAYPSWMTVTDQMQSELDDINSELRQKMESVVDKSKWKEITGVSIREMFDAKKDRIDVTISAKDAKKLGIVKKVINLSSIEAQQINAQLIEARLEPLEIEDENQEIEETTMNAQEIKEKYPEAYSAILAKGVDQEKDRVSSWLAFKDIDAEKVHSGISAGANLTQTNIAEFSATAIKNGFVSASAEENPEGADTTLDQGQEDQGGEGADPSTERISAFEAELDKLNKPS